MQNLVISDDWTFNPILADGGPPTTYWFFTFNALVSSSVIYVYSKTCLKQT